MKIPHAEVHVNAQQVTKKEREKEAQKKGEGASSNMTSKWKKKATK